MSHWLYPALLVFTTACSAPALQTDLAAAEGHEKAGRVDEALASYERAQTQCKLIRRKHVRRQQCAQAHVHRAELLEDQGRRAEAAAAYEKIPAALELDPVPSGKALYRAGRLRLALGEDKRGYELLWKAVTDYPNVAYAVDALRVVFNDGRRRNNRQLYQVLASLVEPLAKNDVADNILFDLAVLAEEDFADPATARAHLDAIIADYRDGGMFDEACWHAARLSRLLDDPRGAAKRLRTLLATREVAIGPGSYFSVWLDDAHLELGRILRDELDAPGKAINVFNQLHEHYPASILRDDATYEVAVAYKMTGDTERACQALDRLQSKWPDSKYHLEKAPALGRELTCPASQRAAEKP